jgi:type IV secretory pathway TraG/TraD family ATPase VirD4
MPAPGQMLIFASGHYPILGTQMLYFLDPELNRRAEIPPPSDFFTIEDGVVLPQKPLDRTANVISKTESAPHEAPHQDDPGEAPTTETGSLSQAQHGFLEQLQLDL